jgi:hypothetical protein
MRRGARNNNSNLQVMAELIVAIGLQVCTTAAASLRPWLVARRATSQSRNAVAG